jgi:hypothetical protein
MTPDTPAQARQHLKTAIQAYREAKAALSEASGIAAQASMGRDIVGRLRAYRTLEDVGVQCRAAERDMARAVRIVRRTLPAKDIAAIAQTFDDAERDEGIASLVRTILTERERACA